MSDAEFVTITIDGQEVRVPKGTNLIEAAHSAGIEIPHYCYHRHLSIAGNCRMCQVEVEGRPKLEIACNTGAQEGMVVRTQETSERTADAQRATLEFLLINHPLDCTVCDQAGHCKLQDYYYEYNAKPSRFIEQKVHKVKAQPLGPNVIYDGERCILCTRCVRFCDEVTETSELGLFNRGDKAVIGIHEGKELDNPFSGCVVDLCPVGALTHRKWRFNTRIWYTGEHDSICTGCSTGCNVNACVRDDQVVQVKGRLNSEVNREWLCDEGRYGFSRFQPETRTNATFLRKENYLEKVTLESAFEVVAELAEGDASEKAVLLSPLLTVEDLWMGFRFAEKVMELGAGSDAIAMQLQTRELSELEKTLISPDYAPNAAAMRLFGYATGVEDWRSALEAGYQSTLARIRAGQVKRLLLVGDFALRSEDLDEELIQALLGVETSVALTPRGLIDGEKESSEDLGAHQLCRVVLPGRTVNEKSGTMLNKDMRVQRLAALLKPPIGSLPEWSLLARAAAAAGKAILPETVTTERDIFRQMTKEFEPLRYLTIAKIGEWGLAWKSVEELQSSSAEPVSGASA